MARIVAVAPDLLLGSKVEAMLGAAGHDVMLSPALSEAPLEGADLLVADLDVENPEALVGLGIPVLGYYSHVEVETREAGRRSGRRRPGGSALAHGPRAAAAGREAAQRLSRKAASTIERALEQAVFEVPRGPIAQHGGVERGRA